MACSESMKASMIQKLLKKAPKPQLHLHLDGSLSFQFIQSCVQRIKIHEPERFSTLFPAKLESLSEIELSDYLWSLKELQCAKGNIAKINGNWKTFDFCNQFLQTKLDIKEAVHDLVKLQNKKYGVDYIEIRFAPCLHTLRGLSEKEIIESALEGFNSAKEDLFKAGVYINGGIILCALRSFPIVDAENLLSLVSEMDVIGFDIAGDEGSYPLSLFESVLRKAKHQGTFITVHAGEWNSKNYPSVLDNLRLAIDIGVNRIGHGLELRNLPQDLVESCITKDIGVEVCITSNCGNPDRCATFSDHPIRVMLEKGIKVSGLNCDNTMLSGNRIIGRPDPLTECTRALLNVKISPNELVSIIENAYKSGFHENAQKQGIESVKVWREVFLPKLIEILNS